MKINITIDSKPNVNVKLQSNYWKTAWKLGLAKVENSEKFSYKTYRNFLNGLLLTMNILPMIMSVGLIGLLLNKYTPVFEYFGYVFYPFTLLVKMPEPLIASNAVASSIAEMFLPSLFIKAAENVSFVTRYTVASISISSIIFFSASIPCILSTKIPLSLNKLIIIWFERVLLGILITTPVAYLIQYFLK